MPILFQYLLKLSCSLAVVYLFYQVVLRRLTFYNTARWYLLGYSLLSFFIPLLNITPFVEQHQLSQTGVVQVIPAIENYTGAAEAVHQHLTAFTLWDAALLLLAGGAAVLLARLLIQYLSFRHIRRHARLLTDAGIKVYQIDKNVTPFSFGNAIYINQRLHNEAELQEIIRHEFVHVTQRHTVDILVTELLCILNWYNPAAWGLRHAIRQNLEFIADNQVLQSGVDKKAYQYLLLKVLGQPQFRVATPFNFSSLKKRIVMMNKLKSARVHLVKFLFVLPLLAVLLLAFRNKITNLEAAKENKLTLSGLVIDATTQEPVANVTLNEIHSRTTGTTDEHGYFAITIPVKQYPVQTEVLFRKDGFESANSLSTITTKTPETAIGTIEIIGLAKSGRKRHKPFIHSYFLSGDDTTITSMPSYNVVLKKLELTQMHEQVERALREYIKDSEKPYWIINGRSYIITKNGSFTTAGDVTDIVFVDGKQLTGDDVNRTIRRSALVKIGALKKEAAQKRYGIDQPVLEIFINTKPAWDTLPAPTPPTVAPGMTTNMTDDYAEFPKRHPEVRSIEWTERDVIITLKSGKKETYRRNDAASMATAVKKWGPFPAAPPVPPSPVITPPSVPIADTAHPPVAPADPDNAYAQQLEFLNEQLAQLAQLNDSVQNGRDKRQAEAVKAYLQQQLAVMQRQKVAVQKERATVRQYGQQNEARLRLQEENRINHQKMAMADARQQKLIQEQLRKEQQQWLLEQKAAEARARKEVLQMYEEQKALKAQAEQMQAERLKEQKAAQERLQKLQDSLKQKLEPRVHQ